MEHAENQNPMKRDMISSLPDCLIHLIMSFLTAQDAVRTCILSKRWKNLWTTLPFLDFDISKFKYDRERGDLESNYGGSRDKPFEKFRDFVSTTLLLRDASNLNKFRLSCHASSCWKECDVVIRSWILYALKHNLQVLHLDLIYSVPLGVFTCAFLVDASLSYCLSVHNIKVINLPCLRRLHLKCVFLNQNFVDKLLCGCPMLEFLYLEGCGGDLSPINSRSLKYMKVQNCNWGGETEKTMKLIKTPNLLSFCYTLHACAIHKLLLKMPSLTHASIYSHHPYNNKNSILISLSYVQNLELSGPGIMDLLENELPNCPEFANLKDLSVVSHCLSCRFNLLASFLNRCPNLEKLSLCHPGCYCEGHALGNKKILKIAPFKGKRLKTVGVNFSKRDEKFCRVVKYVQYITNNSGAQIKILQKTCLCCC